MDLSFSPDEIAFRDEVRDWIQRALPPDLAAKAAVDAPFSVEESMRWHRILFEKGWIAPHWPEEVGGAGMDPTRRFILSEELALAGTPQLSPFGLHMVGPVIIQFGTDAQKRRFLPPILAGDEVWCQGYSEPDAGSDLASLKTRAEDDGRGNLVVNGQKTWTTYAQYADWIFCLVRTDPGVKKQAGITFLLIDMKSPGVTVRPNRTIGGTDAFCDTFFDDVVVPADNIVGPRDGGWTVAKALLGHERTLIAAVGATRRAIGRLRRLAAARPGPGGGTLLDDPHVRERIARAEVRLRALQITNYRVVAGAKRGRAPGPESSILKLRGTELQQEVAELAMDILGRDALAWYDPPGADDDPGRWIPPAYCYGRAATIYGGSNEIQKNIIAKLILGLPQR